MKKIFIGKNEEAAEVVEKIISDEEENIVLMVPRASSLSASVSNFHLIKREADAAKKVVAVESVDENILALARSVGLDAIHPLFEAGQGSSLSDIVPVGGQSKLGTVRRKKRAKEELIDEEMAASPPSNRKDEEPAAAAMKHGRAEVRGGKEKKEDNFVIPEIKEPINLRRKIKFIAGGAVALILVIFIMWFVNHFWSNATITINFKKTQWTYSHSFTADTAVSSINADKNILPAERFTASRNTTQFFPATSFKVVSIKAAGKITVYNAYSSQPQSLVATTRFVTPDGKIFRITDGIVVPGAKIVGGKITPASIEASVVADKPGPEYNVGPISRLDIPGFKGSPKYQGFYGVLAQGTKGGFVGRKLVPTAADIKVGKDKTSDILKASLMSTSSLLTIYPRDFTVLNGASNFAVTKLEVNENTDTNGNFSVFGEATFAAIGFREADLNNVLALYAAKDSPGTVFFKDTQPNYSSVKADLKNGTESFNVSVERMLTPSFSADDFKKQILGKKVGDAGELIKNIEGLADARISVWPTLWPIWPGAVPSDPGKVKIVVN